MRQETIYEEVTKPGAIELGDYPLDKVGGGALWFRGMAWTTPQYSKVHRRGSVH